MRRFRYLIYCISIITLIISISYGTSGCGQSGTEDTELEEAVPAPDASAGQSGDTGTTDVKSGGTDAEQSETAATDKGTIIIYVCGSVQHPDVYRLPEGSRIYEAIEKAGGCTPQADPSRLNLAQVLSDSQRVYVPAAASTGSSTDGSQSEAVTENSQTLININTASKAELMTLPGIGDARADGIIEYRNVHGFFSSADGLREVEGIGEALFERIKDRITV